MSKGKRGTFSAREIRRMNQREKQREQRKDDVRAFWSLPQAERERIASEDAYLSKIQRNGITIEDLDRAGKEGYNDGARIAAENTMRNIYAAVALVMHENYGFGKKRCMDVLNAVDQKVMYALDSKEMIQQVWDDLKIKMTFDGDPLEERITEKGA